MDDLLSMGPPIYFVLTKGLDYSKTKVQNIICGGQGCNTDSLYTQIYSAAKQSSVFVSLNSYTFRSLEKIFLQVISKINTVILYFLVL